jgi:hypothetical protein
MKHPLKTLFKRYLATQDEGKTNSLKQTSKNIMQSLLFGDHKKAQEWQETYSKSLSRGKSVHEISFHNIKPDAMEDYCALTKEFFPIITNSPGIDCKLFGSWNTAVGGLDQASKFKIDQC